jgi:predicted esterase
LSCLIHFVCVGNQGNLQGLNEEGNMEFRTLRNSNPGFTHVLLSLLLLSAGLGSAAQAQAPNTAPQPRPADARAEIRSYHFADTDEDLPYALYVSSKVSPDRKAPLIVALHGLGGSHTSLVRDRAIDLAEEGGYILVGPMGYNSRGWYGIPGIPSLRGDVEDDPANRDELSEKDVMNVLAMAREEFNIDDQRIYLMGHSMGGAGTLYLGVKHADIWAAIAAIAPAAFWVGTAVTGHRARHARVHGARHCGYRGAGGGVASFR